MAGQNVRVHLGSCGNPMYVYTSIACLGEGRMQHLSEQCRNG
jgi:hypothetical protein